MVVDALWPAFIVVCALAGIGLAILWIRVQRRPEKQLERLVQTVGKPWERRLHKRMVVGNPAAEICRVAEDEGADLIIIGTHGRRGLPRWLLGSVAERVVRNSSVPVMTIRADGQEDGAPD